EVSLVKLQSLLDIVLQNSASVGASDPFKEDLKVELTSHRFVDQLQLVQSTSGAGGNHRTSTPGTNSGKRTSGHFSDRTPNHGGTPKTPGDWESGETTPLATSRTPWQQSRQVGGGHSAERPSSTYRNRSESASLPRPLSSYGGGQSAPMKCLEALSFDFVVAFPVSMVINPTLMTKYQLIFRHLLQLKYAEHLLCTGWMGSRAPMTFRRQPLVNSAQTQMSLTLSQRVRKVYERIWFLRNSMLNCLRQIIYYTCFEVLEARWLALEAKVSTVTTIDELTMVHSVFLDHCLQQCMLTVPKLMKILGKLISKCVMFSTFSANLLRSDTFLRPHTLSGESTGPLSSTTSGQLPTTSGNGRSSALSSLQSLQDALTEGDESAAASYVPLKSAPDSYDSLTHQELNLHKMEKSFQQNLEQFLNALNFYSDTETPLFLNLVTKLNLNGYYGSSSQ
ncbi:gamma tubulin complex Spc97/GCP2 subunit Alp4, partial [Dispira parvispora]